MEKYIAKLTNEERVVMIRENKVLRKTLDCAGKVCVCVYSLTMVVAVQ